MARDETVVDVTKEQLEMLNQSMPNKSIITIGKNITTDEHTSTVVAIGKGIDATNGQTVAVGGNAKTGDFGATAIGAYAIANGIDAVAVGKSAWSYNDNCIQIGNGTNRTPNSAQILSTPILKDGKIPLQSIEGVSNSNEGDKFLNDKGEFVKNITVDTELSLTSENPVQNKVITEAFSNIDQPFTDISSDITFDDLEDGKIYRVIQDCTLTDGSQTFELEVNNLIWYDSEYKGAFIINKYGTYYIYANDDTRDWDSCYALNEYDLKENGIIEDVVIDNMLLQELSKIPHSKKILSEKAIAIELNKKQNILTVDTNLSIDSENPIANNAVAIALSEMTDNFNDELDQKQDILTDAEKQAIADLGKEKWTLLIDDTLAEDVSDGVIHFWDADKDGKSYDVKEIFADIVFPNALAGQLALQLNGNSASAIMWGLLPVNTKKVRIRSKLLDNGYIETEYVYYLSTENEITSQNTLKNINGSIQLGSFSKLGIRSRPVSGSIDLPAGTTVKIWSID